MTDLTARQRQVLEFIDAEVRRRGYPPSVREIGEAVGLSSSSTVHAHLAALQDKGYLVRDPTKPRAIEVRFEPGSGRFTTIRLRTGANVRQLLGRPGEVWGAESGADRLVVVRT